MVILTYLVVSAIAIAECMLLDKIMSKFDNTAPFYTHLRPSVVVAEAKGGASLAQKAWKEYDAMAEQVGDAVQRKYDARQERKKNPPKNP